jgi:hypothetical protein
MLIYPFYSELLRQLVAISETLLGADGQLVRAHFKLSTIYADAQKTVEKYRIQESRRRSQGKTSSVREGCTVQRARVRKAQSIHAMVGCPHGDCRIAHSLPIISTGMNVRSFENGLGLPAAQSLRLKIIPETKTYDSAQGYQKAR